MNPAEFRAFCHSLGLSAKALATLSRVQERSVRHWWTDGQPPAGVVELVQHIDATIEHEVRLVLERVQVETKEGGQPPEMVHLRAWKTEAELFTDWMPLQTHSIMLMRIAKALRNVGVPVAISYDKE